MYHHVSLQKSSIQLRERYKLPMVCFPDGTQFYSLCTRLLHPNTTFTFPTRKTNKLPIKDTNYLWSDSTHFIPAYSIRIRHSFSQQEKPINLSCSSFAAFYCCMTVDCYSVPFVATKHNARQKSLPPHEGRTLHVL